MQDLIKDANETSDLVKSVSSQKSAHNVAENFFNNINSMNCFLEMLMKMLTTNFLQAMLVRKAEQSH
jgi:uncharacterized membrane protein